MRIIWHYGLLLCILVLTACSENKEIDSSSSASSTFNEDSGDIDTASVVVNSTNGQCANMPAGWTCNEVTITNPLNSVKYKARYGWNLNNNEKISSSAVWLAGSDGQWLDSITQLLIPTFQQLATGNHIRSVIIDFNDETKNNISGTGGYFKGLDGYRKAAKSYDLIMRHMIKKGILKGSHITHIGGSNGGTMVMFALAYHHADEYLDQVILNAGPQPINIEDSCFNDHSNFNFDIGGAAVGLTMRKVIDLWHGWSDSANEKFCERGVKPPTELLKNVSLLDSDANKYFPHLTINSIIGDKDVYGLAYKRNHILWFENTWAKNMTLDCVPDGEHELDVDLTYQYIVAGPQAKILKQRGANCTKLPVPDSPNVIGILAGIQKQGAIYYLQGWTCVKNYYGSITVGIYFNGDNNSGEHFKNYLASIPSENNINLACETSGTQHRFKIPLTAAELAQHQGKTIYIYGIGPNGFGIGELGKSGTFTVPLAI